MENKELFNEIKEYYLIQIKKGLEKARNGEIQIKEGYMYVHNQPTQPNEEQKRVNKGLLLLANGADLTDFLIERKVVSTKNQLVPTKIGAYENGYNPLHDYLDRINKKDGAVVYDKTSSKMGRVGILKDNGALEEILAE